MIHKMSRPLHHILKRAKQHVPVNKQTTDVLMLFANHQHKDIAKVLRHWLKPEHTSKPE